MTVCVVHDSLYCLCHFVHVFVTLLCACVIGTCASLLLAIIQVCVIGHLCVLRSTNDLYDCNMAFTILPSVLGLGPGSDRSVGL